MLKYATIMVENHLPKSLSFGIQACCPIYWSIQPRKQQLTAPVALLISIPLCKTVKRATISVPAISDVLYCFYWRKFIHLFTPRFPRIVQLGVYFQNSYTLLLLQVFIISVTQPPPPTCLLLSHPFYLLSTQFPIIHRIKHGWYFS